MFQLETDIAARHWDKVTCRDMRLMYNLMTIDDFAAGSPGLHWREFLVGADIDAATFAELVVAQPSFFTEVAELLTEDRIPAWRAWAKWKLISSLSPYLSSAFDFTSSATSWPPPPSRPTGSCTRSAPRWTATSGSCCRRP